MAEYKTKCNVTADNKFGPAVACMDFDFTLTFEHTILVIGTSSLFILASMFRLQRLFKESRKVDGSWNIYGLKIATAFLILAIKTTSLILWTKLPVTKYSIAAASVALVGAIGTVALVTLEHIRSKRPSSAVLVYLFTQIMVESCVLRTLKLRNFGLAITTVSWVSIFAQLLLLALESVTKRSHLKESSKYGIEETAGIFDRSVVWWLNRLFWRGSHHVLKQSDLFQLDSSLKSQRLQNKILFSWDKKKASQHALLETIMSAMKTSILWTIPPRAVKIALTYSQAFLIDAVLSFLKNDSSKRDMNHAYGLIGATALIYIGIAIIDCATQEKRNRMVTTLRGSIISLIYNKALQYPSAVGDSPAVTLISADVDQMSNALMYASEVWAIVAEIAVGVALLWRQMGPVALAPIALTIITAGINTFLARSQGNKRGIWLEAMQKRIGLTSTVLGSMKSVKLSGMSETTAKLLQENRVLEIEKAKSFRLFTVWQNTVASLPSSISGLLVFAAYAVQAHFGYSVPLTTAKAYTSLALISILSQPASMLLQATSAVFSVSGNIERLEGYLKKADSIAPRLEDDRPSKQHSTSDVMVLFESVVLNTSSHTTHASTDAQIRRGTSCMISGPVGAGKSTLLRFILGEAKPENGKITTCASSIGYCSANPWMLNVTIKENIVVGKEWDEQWYCTVLHICDLATDLALLPRGEDSLVGSRGVTLSGGQKHRVALARALYARCPLLLLDDMFSSLDQPTRLRIAQRLLGHTKQHGFTLVFISNDTTLAQFADEIFVLENGTIRICQTSPVMMSTDLTPEFDAHKEDKVDLPISKLPGTGSAVDESRSIPKVASEGNKRQVGDYSVWVYYAKSIGLFHCFMMLLFTIVAVMAANFPRLWLKDPERSRSALGLFIAVYAISAVLESAGMALMLWETMIKISSRSSIRLHQSLVTSTFNAPMSYFDTVDNSVILNRFSQDMTLIESVLPIMTYIVLQSLIACIVQLAFVAMSSVYMVATLPPLLLILYFTQTFYLRTSRQLRYLDLEAKSPLYQQFTETIEGVATIRALRSQEWFLSIFSTRLDESQKPHYLLLCVQRWLGLVLNMVLGATAVVLVAISCTTRLSSAGGLGVALTTILAMNGQLHNLISAWTQAETSIGSVARTKEYATATPNENSPSTIAQWNSHESTWPKGDIQISKLTTKYGTRGNEHVALQDISISFESGQNIGICGRTGSGKSTLISVLLRLVDPESGTVTIGNIDISKIPREVIRKHIICLPQDPILLPGTFEYNLDPEGSGTLPTLQEVLKQVNLWDLVVSRGGLEGQLQPDALSQGERQLLALARAVLRNRQCQGNSILIMDEATSNLDPLHESLMLSVIREEFQGQTVLNIAHKQEALKDCDLIVVLDNAKVNRVGSSEEILTSGA
ncbi:P-loop containing nucleoside triphosphate hydrolase protein [Microthyrium microscopicum]|uniref:P-loop containing nucleoside triphosphate hydrolase protein n=1 Tax=Microthyrium microscopicum TaxID=703497 RepID=A0A6A6U9Q8_9PEZI|nr:P-loop containing nucleoside triphosphate hydrolase protein [Microthyrium microscopicum]